MRFPGRLSAAIEVLTDLDTRKRPASDALRDWGLSHRFAGAGDRAAIGNLVYDALRRRASHAFAMNDDSPRALVLAVAVRDWGEAPEALNALLAGDAHAPVPLTEAEVTRLSGPDPVAAAPGHVRADVPEWLAPAFEQMFGAHWIEEGQGLAERPPLDLRVNTLKSDRARVLKALQRFAPEPTAIAPNGIRIPAGQRDARTPNVQTDESYLKGRVEIQDQGSQIVAEFAGVAPGTQVLDFCAGAGGKTLALAANMQNKGQIFAYDADRNRLAPIYDRLKRNGVRNVQVRAPEDGALSGLEGRMDRVIVDAPCTGTGTWRRRPDAKWRLSAEQLADRIGEQIQILERAALFVRPGGALIYITCSVLPAENSDQIARFLAAHPDFSAAQPTPHDQRMGEIVAALKWRSEMGATLTPASTATDGFFVSVLQRSA